MFFVFVLVSLVCLLPLGKQINDLRLRQTRLQVKRSTLPASAQIANNTNIFESRNPGNFSPRRQSHPNTRMAFREAKVAAIQRGRC